MEKSISITACLLAAVVAGLILSPSLRDAKNEDATSQDSTQPTAIGTTENVLSPLQDKVSSKTQLSEVLSTLSLPHFSEEISEELHAALAYELIERLEFLSSSNVNRKRATASRLSDLVDALTLLKRRNQLAGIDPSFRKVIAADELPRLVALETLWHKDPQFGRDLDSIFSRSGLLTCEHLPQLLLEWTASPTLVSSQNP